MSLLGEIYWYPVLIYSIEIIFCSAGCNGDPQGNWEVVGFEKKSMPGIGTISHSIGQRVQKKNLERHCIHVCSNF